VLAALRIPDLLADGPMTAEQLARPAGDAALPSPHAGWQVAGTPAVGTAVPLVGSSISSVDTLLLVSMQAWPRQPRCRACCAWRWRRECWRGQPVPGALCGSATPRPQPRCVRTTPAQSGGALRQRRGTLLWDLNDMPPSIIVVPLAYIRACTQLRMSTTQGACPLVFFVTRLAAGLKHHFHTVHDTLCNTPNLAFRRDFIIFQGQEMMPAWGSLLQGLRSGNVPWAEAHPAEAAAGRDFWGYLEVRNYVECYN
jgi:hypothetical protein